MDHSDDLSAIVNKQRFINAVNTFLTPGSSAYTVVRSKKDNAESTYVMVSVSSMPAEELLMLHYMAGKLIDDELMGIGGFEVGDKN